MGRFTKIVLGAALCATMLGQTAGAQEAPAETSRKVLNKALPIYPELASRMHLEGSVKLLVTVAPNGTVKSVEIRGGHPLLVSAAENAVYKWRWAPAKDESKEIVNMEFHPN